jgi:hypothetical protein
VFRLALSYLPVKNFKDKASSLFGRELRFQNLPAQSCIWASTETGQPRGTEKSQSRDFKIQTVLRGWLNYKEQTNITINDIANDITKN